MKQVMGEEWLRKGHRSPYYKSLYHQNDFEAVILICLFLNHRLYNRYKNY